MAVHVINEAHRCLQCKNPQCKKGCPIGTQIPEMIQTFLEGRISEAGERLFENNPLSIVCSLVCDHEHQCEGHCILNKKGMPVQISSIEHYISSYYFDTLLPEQSPKNGKRVALIGGGPAGITIAMILSRLGYEVTLFETKDKIGGVLRYGIPEFRLPKRILDQYEQKLTAMGIRIRPNTTIGRTISMDDLFRDGYLAVFIGTGVWRPSSLRIKGESLGNCHFAINYLFNPDSYHLGNRVAVIGAGNSAMDVARTALRKGAREVTVFARDEQASASKRELEYALADGVRLEVNYAPVEITPEGPLMIATRKNQAGELEDIPGGERVFPADSTIIAIGQGPRDKIISNTKGIDANERGLLVTDEQGHTTRQGVFAGGDVVRGAKTVVEAVDYSKQVAMAMHAYLQGL